MILFLLPRLPAERLGLQDPHSDPTPEFNTLCRLNIIRTNPIFRLHNTNYKWYSMFSRFNKKCGEGGELLGKWGEPSIQNFACVCFDSLSSKAGLNHTSIIELSRKRLIYSSLLPRNVLELLSRCRYASLFCFRYNQVALFRILLRENKWWNKGVRSTSTWPKRRGFTRPNVNLTAGNTKIVKLPQQWNVWQIIPFRPTPHAPISTVTAFQCALFHLITFSQQSPCQSKHLVNLGKGTHPMHCTGQVRSERSQLYACKVTCHLL